MKNQERVEKLFQELLNEAESSYEINSINLLKQKLKDGTPKVQIISDTCQIFNGHTYTKRKDGYYKRHELLHVAVMESYIGHSIEQGYDVHHIYQRDDNNIENLRLLTVSEHIKLHWSDRNMKEYKCEYCGKFFYSRCLRGARFCSSKCMAASCYHSKRVLTEKICPICGKTFIANKMGKAITCSHACGATLMWQKRKK